MSLAAQLKQLQIPDQPFAQKDDSKKASLLFDRTTAAGLDNEAILSIGQSGLEELKAIDQIFAQYEKQLFSSNSLSVERTLQDKSYNQKLQTRLTEFLFLLSPYVQLKPAQKCLEWLIRKYRVHVYDKDALLACILPYHETHLFGRVVQLFGTKPSGDHWDWLLPCQKSAQGFSVQTLIKHCTDNRTLLSYLWTLVSKAASICESGPKSGLRLFFSFFSRVMICVIETVGSVKEDMVSFLLPFVYEGMKSKHTDFIISSYMVLMQLCSKGTFTKDVVKNIITMIVKVCLNSEISS